MTWAFTALFCNAGALGNDPQGATAGVALREGVTLLAASAADQPALVVNERGLFTQLVVGALAGGAADVQGRVTSASIYAYVDQVLGPWDQRPIYKSSARRVQTVRYCRPLVWENELRALPVFFTTSDARYRLDPSYEYTFDAADPEHVKIFNLFKIYRNAGLLQTTIHSDLYFAAKYSSDVKLTPLGQFYWLLAERRQLPPSLAFATQRRPTMPDPESVARLFHETYERLAPQFNYETRRATARPWDEVPEDNRRLMIAVANEVLSMLFPPQTETPADLPALPEA